MEVRSGRRILGLHLVHRAALDEQALHRLERRELVVRAASACASASMPKSRARKSSTCGAARPGDPTLPSAAGGVAARRDQAIAQGGVALAEESRGTRRRCAASPSRSYRSLKRMPKPRCMAGRIIFEIRAFPGRITLFPNFQRGLSMQIKNSVFLVTGGASGLGEATARMPAENGAQGRHRRPAGRGGREAGARARRPLRQDATSPRRPTARRRSRSR